MFKSKEAEELQQKLDAAQKEIAKLTEQIAGLVPKADLETANGKITELNTKISGMVPKAELDAANAKLEGAVPKADFDKKVEAAVNERLAAAGVDPIKRDPKGAIQGSTREELQAQLKEIKDPS